MASVFSIRTKPDEPYLTQVLSYVLDSDRRFCIFVLEAIFGIQRVEGIVRVVPEEREEGDQPDIRIDCQVAGSPARVAIENKIDAPFQDGQVPRYKGKYDFVAVLYRTLADPEQGRLAHGLKSWANLCLQSREYLNDCDDNYDPVHRFLIEELIGYLEESGMGIGKVSWEIENGTKALQNLFDQVEEALGRLVEDGTASRKMAAGSASKNYYGWKLTASSHDMYVYVMFSPPMLTAYFSDKNDYSFVFEKLVDVHPDLYGRDLHHIGTLRLLDGHYLCLSVDEQIDVVEAFVRSVKDRWEAARSDLSARKREVEQP